MPNFINENVNLDVENESSDDVKEVEKIRRECGLQFSNLWDLASPEEVAAAWDFAEDYKQVLSECKTERLFADHSVKLLSEQGFKSLRGTTS